MQFGQLGILQGGVARPAQRYYRYAAGKLEEYVIGLDSTGHEQLGLGMHAFYTQRHKYLRL